MDRTIAEPREPLAPVMMIVLDGAAFIAILWFGFCEVKEGIRCEMTLFLNAVLHSALRPSDRDEV